MPTYEYRCSEGHRFEAFQRMSDEPLDSCPECGADARRLVSAGAGLLFKGDGFYITDYRSDDYRKKAAAESGSGDGGGSGSESKGSGNDSNGSSGGGSGSDTSKNGTGAGSPKGASGGKKQG